MLEFFSMTKNKPAKNPAAVALGRLGGAAKVPKGFSALSAEERKANASAAAKKRWKNAKKQVAKR